MKIYDKIAKLLALAESPNETEALAALLKAKELMMKHKLTMAEFETTQASREVKEINTGITCSRRRDHWTAGLGNTIAEHHCCRCLSRGQKGKQTVEILFWGLVDDVELCNSIFLYALSCIESWLTAVKKDYAAYPANVRRDVRFSYAKGYIDGINFAYQKQADSHQEWSLVAVTPKEVEEKAEALDTREFSARVTQYQTIYQEGYEDGCKFEPGSKPNGGE